MEWPMDGWTKLPIQPNRYRWGQDIPDQLVLKATTKIYQKWCSFGTIDILLDQNDCCFVIFLRNVQRVPSNRSLVKEAKNAKNAKITKKAKISFFHLMLISITNSPTAVILAGTVPLT